MLIPNKNVDKSPNPLRWKREDYGQAYSSMRGSVRVQVVRRYAKRWVVRIDGHFIHKYDFTGPQAAKRYAEGAAITDIGSLVGAA